FRYVICQRAELNVVGNGIGKEEDLLWYNPDLITEIVQVDVFQVLSVNQDLSLLRINLTHEQLENGAFSAGRASYDGSRFSCFNREAQIAHRRDARIGVGVTHIAEFDTPLKVKRLVFM